MQQALHETEQLDITALCARFEARLRMINKYAVRAWFNRERLDDVLMQIYDTGLPCDLVYAIGCDGHQISSNVFPGAIDITHYGQDLSGRPYSITISALHNAAFQGAFFCGRYTSKVTQSPCITLMHGITSGPAILGFVAADFDIHSVQQM